MRSLIPLSDAGSAHGGKAQGLRALMELGLAVPEGIALDGEAAATLAVGDPRLLQELEEWLGRDTGPLVVRSSALNEDGDAQSFAGIYESILNVARDARAVADAVHAVSASGGLERVESYSGARSAAIPVIIQRMVQPAASGVLFTRAIDGSGSDCAYIEWVHGLGDALLAGRVTPSSVRLGWEPDAGNMLASDRLSCDGKIPEAAWVAALAELVETIDHAHESRSMDVEWSIDQSHRLWALQVRPVTRDVTVPNRRQSGGALAASAGVGEGPVRQIDDETIDTLCAGEVLVTRITETTYIPAMKLAAAIVTEEGGLLSHAAIVARELGKPCVVGLAGATTVLRAGEAAYVDGGKAIVVQGDRTYGSGQEIDWSSVYLYDRGYEIDAAGVPLYVEPTLDGVLAFVDSDTAPDIIQQVDVELRRFLHVEASVVQSDRRIWYKEWRRFNRLESVALVHGLFRAAIASWSVEKFDSVVALLDWAAHRIGRVRRRRAPEMLFWHETGAALHALVAVVVEGEALWAIYRDSASWRKTHGVSFPAFLRHELQGHALTPRLEQVFPMMQRLGELRNHAYPHFSTVGAFSTDYFGDRSGKLAATYEVDIEELDDDAALERLYGNGGFQSLDRQFAAQIARRYFKSERP